MAKQASNQAYVRAKREMEEAELRRQNGEPDIDTSDKDVFEVQHHHLLNCLEKTTVSLHISIITLLSLKISNNRVERSSWETHKCLTGFVLEDKMLITRLPNITRVKSFISLLDEQRYNLGLYDTHTQDWHLYTPCANAVILGSFNIPSNLYDCMRLYICYFSRYALVIRIENLLKHKSVTGWSMIMSHKWHVEF